MPLRKFGFVFFTVTSRLIPFSLRYVKVKSRCMAWKVTQRTEMSAPRPRFVESLDDAEIVLAAPEPTPNPSQERNRNGRGSTPVLPGLAAAIQRCKTTV